MKSNRPRPRNIELIKQKLQTAVDLAKETLVPPPDIINVNGGEETSYVTVESATIDEKSWLYVLGSGQDRKKKILFKTLKDKFRTIVFVGLIDSRIFIMEKPLKLTFLYCRNCQISIRGGSVGPVEFIKCESTNVDIRGDAKTNTMVPLIQIDMSTNVHFYQRSDELAYAVCKCNNITGVIVDPSSGKRIKQTPMETSMFGEQSIFLFSKEEGIVQTQTRHILNDISHHLSFKDIRIPGEDSDDEEDTLEKYKTLAFSPPTE